MKVRAILCVSTAALMQAGTAAAQTGPGVTLYGIVDVSMRSQSGLTAAYVRSAGDSRVVASGVGPTSRWGLRGTEDLGGGMRATFNLESGINVDTGIPANNYFDRASVVGLAGPWGSVNLGRQNTLVADSVGLVDPIGLRFAGMNPNIQVTSLTGHLLGIEFGNTGSTAASNRVNNGIKYALPVGKVVLRAMHSLGEVSASNSKLNSTGWGIDYIDDALTATASYTRFKDANDRRLDASNLGVSWRTGAWRLTANIGRNDGDTSATASTRNRITVIGANYAVTPAIDLLAGYYKIDRSRTGQADDGFRRLIAFGEYKFTRRTRVFLEFDHTRWRGNYGATGAKGTSRGLSAGITHTF